MKGMYNEQNGKKLSPKPGRRLRYRCGSERRPAGRRSVQREGRNDRSAREIANKREQLQRMRARRRST